MRTMFPPIKSKPVFELDFILAYFGVLLLELSITGTELFMQYPENKLKVIQIRLIHTFALLVFLFITQKILKARSVGKAGYFGLCLVGLWFAIPALLLRIFLMQNFELITGQESKQLFIKYLVIALMQAFFWIPVVIIFSGQRNKITTAFKVYENKLIIISRKNVRMNKNFDAHSETINQDFRAKLQIHSEHLLNSLTFSDNKKLALKDRNAIIQRYLRNNSVRQFSEILNKQSKTATNNSKFNRAIKLFISISKQFNFLYNATARKAPLETWVYTLLSIALIIPNYINFFSFYEVLFSAPPLFLAIHLVAVQINRILNRGGKYAILITNLMIFSIGLMPFIQIKITNLFIYNLDSKFPALLSALFYPVGFFILIRFIQIINPETITSFESGEIKVSPSLERKIFEIVEEEFRLLKYNEWSTLIHGKVLTRIAATALRLEQAAALDDSERFETGLQNIKLFLNDPTSSFEQKSLDLMSEVLSRLDPWESLIDIDFAIEPELKSLNNNRVKELGNVIEEIITNSIRHGGSRSISINITSGNRPDIQIHIEDDAVNQLPLVPSRIGFGTKILDLASDGRWSISRVDEKTTVIVTMSLLGKGVS